VTQRTLDTIKSLLMTSAREETLSALANFTHRVKLLMERPDQLDGFVSFQKMFTDLSRKKKAASKEATLVDELYDLLNIYFGADAKLPTADQVKIDDLHEAVASYTQGMSDADDFIEDRKQSNIATLEKNIATMNDELLAVLGTLHGGSFMEPDSDPFEVVTELEKMQTDVATMRQRSEQYQEYQKLFNMPMDDFGNLALVEKECANRYGVWKLLFDFETNSHAWTTNPVQSLTIANVLAEVDNAATSAYKMGKADKENRVVYRLKDTVDEFKQILPLIEELANQALSDRHWKVNVFPECGSMFPERSQMFLELCHMSLNDGETGWRCTTSWQMYDNLPMLIEERTGAHWTSVSQSQTQTQNKNLPTKNFQKKLKRTPPPKKP
jgi:dynein heavy chain